MDETSHEIRVEMETTDGGKVEYTLDEVRDIALDLHRRHRNFHVAEQLYRMILTHRPNDVQAMEYLGILLTQTRRRDAAMTQMLQAAELVPDNPSLWNNIGNMRVYADDPQGAGEAYRRAIALAPEAAMPLVNLGSVQHLTGQHADARHNLERALELEPDYAHGWFRYGALLAKLKDEAAAAKALGRAVALSGDHRLSGEVGFYLIVLGQLDEARALYGAWTRDEPDNPVARHKLAALEGAAPERCEEGYVTQLFDGFAETFEAQLTRLDYRAPELVRERIEALSNGRRDLAILDAGCGTGWCGRFLRDHAARLVGVDLSPNMLQLAEREGHYDTLEVGELTAYLQAHPEEFDRIVVCDTLCYFGALDAFAEAAMAALRPGGALIATVEAMQEDDTAEDYLLQINGRYRQSAGYLRRVFGATGGEITALDGAVLRHEANKPVEGYLLTLERPF